MPLISVIILTKDEELNLASCLASLDGLDAEIFVVDSESTDRTADIAREFGATVVQRPFETQARQINWALDHLPLSSPWIMRLDADERLTPELRIELQHTLAKLPDCVVGLVLRRRVYFWGRWIRYGGYYPTWLLRVWRKGSGRAEDVWMDEHISVAGGETWELKADIIDENRKGLAFWVNKHNEFSDREVRALLSAHGPQDAGQIGRHARRKRFLKTNIYARSPLFLRAFLYWAYRYFLRGGFLDGKEGFVFHFLQGFWYRMLIDAKLYEHERNLKRPETKSD